jgi:hypothetical protein
MTAFGIPFPLVISPRPSKSKGELRVRVTKKVDLKIHAVIARNLRNCSGFESHSAPLNGWFVTELQFEKETRLQSCKYPSRIDRPNSAILSWSREVKAIELKSRKCQFAVLSALGQRKVCMGDSWEALRKELERGRNIRIQDRSGTIL